MVLANWMLMMMLGTTRSSIALLLQQTPLHVLSRRYGYHRHQLFGVGSRCFSKRSDSDDNDTAQNSELLAREREVFRKVKPELRKGYRWLQRLEQGEPLLQKDEEPGFIKQKPRKKKQNKKKKMKKKRGRQQHDWFYNFGPATHHVMLDHNDNDIPMDHVLIGQAKSSLKLSAADLTDLEVIEQPNPYNSRYRDLQWVNVTQAASIASEKHGGAAGFLSKLVRTAGVKNKQQKAKATTSQQELQRLKTASNNTNLLARAKENLRDTYHLPLYTNNVESLQWLGATTTTTTTVLDNRAVEACARRHFLMTFTEFPLIRNERSSLLMWISRFPDGHDQALAVPALPKSMHAEIEQLWQEFFRPTKTTKQQQQAAYLVPVRELETSNHEYNVTQLQSIDAASRERAQRFIDLGLPNVAEARLVENVLKGDLIPSITAQFPYLFRVEWMPVSGVGQGDLVLVSRLGTQFAVIEAKANTQNQASKVKHVQQQSAFYAMALRQELRHTSHQVYAGYVTDQGFSWLSDDAPPPAPLDEETVLVGAVQVDHDDDYTEETRPVPATAGFGDTITDHASPRVTTASESAFGLAVANDVVSSPATSPLQYDKSSRFKELEAMTIRGGLRELLVTYKLPITGKKADLIGRILQHEEQVQHGGDLEEKVQLSHGIVATNITNGASTDDDDGGDDNLTVAPSRREQLEAMNIEHELKALCYLYGVRPKKPVKQEYVETVWSYESSTPGISAGF